MSSGIGDLLPQLPWEGPPIPVIPSRGCSPGVVMKVRNTIYYHGYKRKGRYIRREMYFTAGREFAEDFAGGSHTPEGITYYIVKAKINPLNPYCARGPMDVISDFPLRVLNEYRKLVPQVELTWEQLQRGEGFISGQIRRSGYDSWIRMNGDMIVVYDPRILTILATVLEEGTEP